jgi:hypothetical protein
LQGRILRGVLRAGTEFVLATVKDATPARRTVQRLMDEGLDRHEAIHAIGSLFAKFILMNAPESVAEPNAPYFAALEWLTARGWRRSQ